MKKIEWTAPKTQVDRLVCKYLDETMGRGHIHRHDIVQLIEDSRCEMGVDAIYMFEENLDKDTFEVTYGSFADGVSNLIGFEKAILGEKAGEDRSKFDENGLYAYCKNFEGHKLHILSFGIFQEEVYEGSVNLMMFGKRTYDWSNDEKYNLIKLGRALHQKVALTHDRKMKKKLQDALAGKDMQSASTKRYMSALAYFTNGYFETNISKDLVTSDIIEEIDDENMEYRTRKAEFSTITQMRDMLKGFVRDEDRQAYIDFMDRDRMIQCCENGDYIQNFRFCSKRNAPLETWYEALIILSKDEATQDVMGINFMNDVTEEINNGILLKDALNEAQVGKEAKNTFLFNMSHDVRTPMNAILGFTALAKKHMDDKNKAIEYLDKAEAAENQLLNMMNEILDMARIVNGQVNLNYKPMNIVEEVRSAERIFDNEMVKKGLRFDIYKKVDDEQILCDHVRLKQMILIIVGNSLRYTKPGGKVSLKITQSTPELEGKAWYEIRVKDTGVGMSKDFQERLFNTFEREQNMATSGIEGTGLGLSIVKGLVDLMKGTIWVESELGKGTEITIKLPLEIYKGQLQQKQAPVDGAAFVGTKVLLVEENALNREITKEMLVDEGLVVTEAEDGSVALEILNTAKAGDFDLVLMDIHMPFMDGYLTTQAIRSMSDEKIAKIPIIAMTANAFEEDKQKSFVVGMNDHISKPIDLPKLFGAMQRVL